MLARSGPAVPGASIVAAETPPSARPTETEAEVTIVAAAPPQLPWLERSKAGTGAEKETVFEAWPATSTCTDEEPPVPLPLAFGSSTVAMMELSE